MTARAHDGGVPARPGKRPGGARPPRREPRGGPGPLWHRLATSAGPLQAKLTVNAPGDAYEREADQVADQVMRMPDPGMPGVSEAPPAVSPRTESRIASLRSGGGAPLSPALRSYFEPRFGRDLSAVRLHAGGEAAEAAREVHARAFTVGRDVAFGAGEYRPESAEGKRLLAHELAHTVQQGAAGTIRRTTYIDCTDDQLTSLVLPAKRRALADLDAVIPRLSADPLSNLVKAALFLAFRSDSTTTASTVASTLQEIRDGIESGTIECEQPDGWQYMCENDRLGYTNFAGTMHVCMNAWPDSTDRLRTLILIHEGGHAFSWMVGDSGYFGYEDCAEDESTSGLDTAARLRTPDAFSCFVSYLRYDTGIEDRARSYRGANLAIEQRPAGPIDLNGPDPHSPMFSITGVPDNSGFRFRWVLADGDDRRYLMRDDSGVTFDYGSYARSYIGGPTRALLRERGIHQGKVLCRVDVPAVGNTLFTQDVTFTY
ncbi:MAG TPA: DUF4157 domain-containing protein [Thermoanaerobaculia bacterium]|nr:DUF4157 domain-containing protein [Thermoanaerobaculia bacterium]